MKRRILKFNMYQPEKYSIAVKTGDGLFQRYSIKRTKSGDVYFSFLGCKSKNNVHNSLHASGEFHHKINNKKIFKKNTQQPNVKFRGTENIVYTSLNTKDAQGINKQYDSSKFTDVMEISESLVNIDFGKQLSVDLIEPDAKPWPSTCPYANIIQQQIFKLSIPWIVVSLFQISQEPLKK